MSIIFEMSSLTTAQDDQVTQLLESIKKQYNGKYPPQFDNFPSDEVRRVQAFKYLKARKWSSKDAMTMVMETMKFREENKLDGMALFPCAIPISGVDQADINKRLGLPERPKNEFDHYYKSIAKEYSSAFVCFDKLGHPLIVDRLGHTDVHKLNEAFLQVSPVGKRPTDVGVAYFSYVMEVARALELYFNILQEEKESKAEGAPITTTPSCRSYTCTFILDAGGMTIKMFYMPVVNVLQAALTVMQKYYPDVVHQFIVINSPSIIQMAYNLVKGTLDENTQKKVKFYKKAESLAALKETIDVENIPKEYGGELCPEGGAIPRPGGAEDRPEDDEEMTEEINVGAGKVHTVSYDLADGEEIVWHFIPVNADDTIQFSATFEPTLSSSTDVLESSDPDKKAKKKTTTAKKKSSKGDKGTSVVVVEAEKVKETSGEYLATEPGTLNLMWDNSHSWVYGKKIQMRIMRVVKPDSP